MGRYVKIQWVGVDIPTMGRGVDMPWVWASIFHGKGGQNTMGKWVVIPWVGGKIPWVGGRYTMGRGSIFHRHEGQKPVGRGSI
jgi:hypothetical protein